MWIRHHVVPRTRLFVPEELEEAARPSGYPAVDSLQDLRYTVYSRHGGKYAKTGAKLITLTDIWPEASTRALKHQWTGKTLFLKKGAASSLSVEGDKPLALDGKIADATALLSANLHGLRAELGEAQRQDPSLREIIAVLERQPAGKAVAAPRGGDFKRARARA